MSETEFEDESLQTIQLSIETKQFLNNTRTGRAIKTRAEFEIAQAKELLLNATSMDQVRDLQFKAAVPLTLLAWLDELIYAGDSEGENDELY